MFAFACDGRYPPQAGLSHKKSLTLPDSMSGVEGPRGTRSAADSGASCHGIAGG